MKRYKTKIFYQALALLFVYTYVAFCQETPWHAGTIGKINIECSGPKHVTVHFIRTHLGIAEGQTCNRAQMDAALKRLYRTGWFDNIKILQENETADGFDIKVCLHVLPKIRKIEFTGNRHLRDNALLSEIKSRSNQPLDELKLRNDCQRLLHFYESKGYCDANVQVVSGQQDFSGYRDVQFLVAEGFRYRLQAIRFEGIHACTEKELLSLISTKTWDWLAWLTHTGVYKKDQLRHDLDRIVEHYQNKGFLDVNIDAQKIRLVKTKTQMRITIPIEEGTCYTIHSIQLTTDDALPPQRLIHITGLKEGDVCSPEKIELAREKLRDFYGCYGYIDVEVQVKRLWVDGKSFDLQFTVHRGIQSKINSIYITGNINTQARVILRETNLAPGDIIDRTRMKKAEQRLINTGFFNAVSILPEDTNTPHQKNLKISVEEAKTGSVFFSGGFNSEEKMTVGVTLSQNNFDYKNTGNYFRGAGQKFQLSTSLGKYSNEINLSFEEPWLFDRELRFGFNVFRTVNKYTSDNYTEQHLGSEIYLWKRLFEQVQGKIYYRIEEFNLKDVKQSLVSSAIWAERGKRSLSKIGFSMERDTRDHFLYPTEGSYLEWDNQLAGGPCRGQTNYMRTRFTAAKWFLITPEHEQTFLVGGKVGTVRGFGGKEVPLFEREFLGGPDDLRGFDSREVGPKTQDKFHDPLGGKSFAFSKIEYSAKVHSIVRLVGFFDVGFVNEKTFCWKSSGYNCNWGIGIRLHILGAPFCLNFAFPFKTDNYNKKKAPHISYHFGVSF
ncbi:MAG: outer membrane protein assembly factor BamA [Puniceicoccales bacterium]|nr:outer membrane protein assembly factor BamA [Puniceicoccales bacterium]